VLLMDQCAVCSDEGITPKYECIIYLPSNTSDIQPLAQDIMYCMNKHTEGV
jgi:hypothetical protein